MNNLKRRWSILRAISLLFVKSETIWLLQVVVLLQDNSR
nr:MAG TPA: hypothetical protein [Caudoviricetes sp.]